VLGTRERSRTGRTASPLTRYDGPGANVLRLGSVVLAAVLLGVPRALEARAFGAEHAIFVEVSPAEGLQDLATALERALVGFAWSLAGRASEATTVVELEAVTQVKGPGGRPLELVRVAVRDARGPRPLLLQYAPGNGAGAAHALVARLATPGREAC
jgi:hypothetical protein